MFTNPDIYHKLSPLTDIHGAGATDALPAGPPEGQAGVHLVLDLDERVQHHGPAVVQVDLVILHLGLGPGLLGIPSGITICTELVNLMSISQVLA